MNRNTIYKTICALTIIGLVLVFYFVPIPKELYQTKGDWLLRALTHPFFHSNVFHLAANSIALWNLLKYGVRDLPLAFAISVVTFWAPVRPVIGISNVIFALIGLRSPSLKSSWWRSRSTIIFLLSTSVLALLPNVSVITHTAAFATGFLAARFKEWIKAVIEDYGKVKGN